MSSAQGSADRAGDVQVETYNAAAALWQEVRGALAEALELTAGGADVWRTFWAAQQEETSEN